MKNLYRLIILTGIIFGTLSGNMLHGQETALFSQAVRNQEFMNPAYNSDKDYLSAVFLFRDQWAGVVGNPQIMGVNFRYPIIFGSDKNFDGFGVSVNILGETLGLRNIVDAGINLDTYLQLGTNTFMGIGINIGFEFYQYDLDKLISFEDPNIINNLSLKGVLPNVGLGILLKHKNYRFGISSFTLVKDALYDKAVYLPGFDVFAKASYKTGNSVILMPSVLVKSYAGFSTTFDVNLTAVIKDILGVGVGYRYTESFYPSLTLKIADLFLLSYSYDYPLAGIATYGKGSHEISLSFGLKQDDNPRKGRRMNDFE